MTLRDKFYLFRKAIYTYLSDVVKIIFYPKTYKITVKERVNSNIQRYVEGTEMLLGKPFKYTDLLSFNFIKNEMFNLEIYKFETQNQQPFIIDCGANIGLSIVYFKKIYPNAQILAFEPDLKVFNVLKENIDTLQLNDIQLINKALWSTEGTMNFYSEGADGGRIESFSQNEVQTIDTTVLSNFINQQIDFLKIDIEGAEYEVINECKNKLKYVENLFIEYHSFDDKPQELNKILEILSENKFRYYISTSVGVKSPHPFVKRNTYLGMDNQLNIFAKKQV
jgi:FkbM family methyltransferase